MRRFLWVGFLVALLILPGVGHAATAKLAWTDNATNEDGFNIQRKLEACIGSGAFTQLAQTAANVVAYDDPNLVEGNQYCYRVNAYNASGVSAWSNTVGAIVPYTAASAPMNAAVTATGVLTWVDKTTNETGFTIQRKAEACAGTATFGPLGTVGANVVTYTDTSGVPGNTYCYRVMVQNGVTNSPFSNTAERTIPLAIPADPSQLGLTLVP